MHAFAGAASGALGAVATGGDPAFAAVTGGISAGASAWVGGVFPIAGNGVGAFLGSGLQRTVVGSILGGGTSLVMGGSFGEGAAMGARTSAIAYMANEAMHQATEKAVNTLITQKEPGPTKDINKQSNQNNPSERAESKGINWKTVGIGTVTAVAGGLTIAGTLMSAAATMGATGGLASGYAGIGIAAGVSNGIFLVGAGLGDFASGFVGEESITLTLIKAYLNMSNEATVVDPFH